MEIYLIRHTKVTVPLSVCYGRSDVALADSFEVERDILWQKIHSIQPQLLVSSPLQRCASLCDWLAQQWQIEPQMHEDALMEMDFGDWELRSWNEIPEDESREFFADFVHIPAPGGESMKKLNDRSVSCFEKIVSLQKNPSILVTHGGVIRSLICHVLEIPLKNAFRFQLDHGSVSKLSIKHGLWQVEYLNR
jgi:alpha-ribazole phosphatase